METVLTEVEAKEIILKLLDQLSETKEKDSEEQVKIDLAQSIMEYTWRPIENLVLHHCYKVLLVLVEQDCTAQTLLDKLVADNCDPLSIPELISALLELTDRTLVETSISPHQISSENISSVLLKILPTRLEPARRLMAGFADHSCLAKIEL